MLQFIGVMEEKRENLRVSRQLLNFIRTGQFFLIQTQRSLYFHISSNSVRFKKLYKRENGEFCSATSK